MLFKDAGGYFVGRSHDDGVGIDDQAFLDGVRIIDTAFILKIYTIKGLLSTKNQEKIDFILMIHQIHPKVVAFYAEMLVYSSLLNLCLMTEKSYQSLNHWVLVSFF